MSKADKEIIRDAGRAEDRPSRHAVEVFKLKIAREVQGSYQLLAV